MVVTSSREKGFLWGSLAAKKALMRTVSASNASTDAARSNGCACSSGYQIKLVWGWGVNWG